MSQPLSVRLNDATLRRLGARARRANLPSFQETLYLFSTRANAAHIPRGLAEARDSGPTVRRGRPATRPG